MDDIRYISIEDEKYPELLKSIQNPPKVIYYKGILPEIKEKCLAIVGSRNYSGYGQQTALKLSGQLTDKGFTIISGLALGIDTFCHRAVVEKRKRTIAVLGTGLNNIYPKINTGLAEKIVQCGGCLISELPPESRGTKFSFPNRNRIISALSGGVLVIEAKEKSGSLITARYAKQQHKKIFAVPGQINNINSEGPNKLIKEGAILVENVEDIIEGLGYLQLK